MNQKLVICDIDNTLVVKHHQLTPRAKAAIDRLREHGIYFGIASGRSLNQIHYMVHSWGLQDVDLLIGMNGCELWDGITKTKHEQFLMKKAWLKEVVEFMQNHPSENTLMYVDDYMIYTHDDELMQASIKASNMPAYKIDDLSLFYREDNAKIMFRVNEATMHTLETHFRQHPNEHYQAFKTQPTMLEFCNKQVSKAYALRKFCEMHDVDMADVTAFGDTSNDNDMISASGWGVCMQNGSADTKAIADEITEKPCAEDGWADYMERRYFTDVCKR